MLPSFHSGEDPVGIGGPDEGLGIIVGFLDEAVDGGLEIDDRPEDAASEASSGELGEEAFDSIEPGGGGRSEVEGPARMPGQPGDDLRMLVGGVIVDDGVDDLADWDLRFVGVQEPDELLMAVALHVAPDNGAVEHI